MRMIVETEAGKNFLNVEGFDNDPDNVSVTGNLPLEVVRAWGEFLIHICDNVKITKEGNNVQYN